MHRFFVPSEAITDGKIEFPPESARQIRQVLRLKAGGRVIALDGRGEEFRIELTRVGPERVGGVVLDRSRNQAEAQVQLTLFLSLTQREKFEWVLQKCTEIGAHAFMPFVSSRSLVKLNSISPDKIERWQRIIKEAAEQSGRGIIPVLEAPKPFDLAVQSGKRYDLCLAAWEEEHSQPLRPALQDLPPGAKVAVMIGPEGGMSREEIDQASPYQWQTVSLGARILRMETAALVACTLVMDAVQ